MLAVVKRGSLVSRRLLIAALALGLFLLFDIALFGWMIFRSLSQREVEEVLLETRLEAETLAEQIARSTEGRGDDLFTALASEAVVQRYMEARLRERGIVSSLEVRDRAGRLVYTVSTEVLIPVDPGLEVPLDSPELAPGSEVQTEVVSQGSFSYEVPDVQVPIGDIGTLQIGVDPQALRLRIEKLRRDLIREASLIGGVTVALLLSAYLIIWMLYRRSRRFEVQAAEAERMAYIGTLASGLAHEIRNPLNSLSLNMQMLGEELPNAGAGGSGARLLEITRAEIGRLERLVTDFLSYARPRPPELEEVAAAELLDRTRQMLCGAARNHGVKLEAIDSTGGARLLVDPAQVRQLLLNLAQNALAATEERGRAAVVRLRAERRGATAVLAVEDNGAGIPAADRERVFDLFYSTKKGGTGLGLAIVDRIAKNHGGRVDLESEPGKGTVFSVLLPGAVVGEVVEAEAAHA
jgi:signal transduction histidine kinase